jgi:hypothetical protein
MQHKYKFLFTCFLILITALNTYPQESKKPVRLLIMEDVVYPYKLAEYENAQKAINEFFKKNVPGLSWETYQTDDFTYMYIIPFSSLSEVEGLFTMMESKIKAADQKEFGKLYGAFAGVIDHNHTLVVELADSYNPENRYLKPEEGSFIHWDFFELLPGKDMEARGITAQYKKLNEKLNIPVPYNLWSTYFGPNSTTLVFSTRAKDDVDFYTRNKESDDKMMKDPEGSAIYMNFLASVRSFHHFNGKARPDLSIKKQ